MKSENITIVVPPPGVQLEQWQAGYAAGLQYVRGDDKKWPAPGHSDYWHAGFNAGCGMASLFPERE